MLGELTDDFQRHRWGWDAPTVTALAQTRALENGVWLAMSCCVGPEWQFDSIGHSCIVAPSGKVVASLGRSVGAASHEVVFEDDMLKCRALAREELLAESRWSQLAESAAHLLSPLL